jgi:uncharacterized repeat protein (TIGR02543 family)/uncharacterized delta-60 repeat protein
MENILNIFTALHNSKKHNIKRIILAALLFLIFTSFMSLNAQWAKTYGGESVDKAYSIQQTIDGGYIVAGETWSFGDSQGDFWVLKLTSSGDIEWEKTYGGNNAMYWVSSDIAYSIQQTSDGGYIVAGSSESFNADFDDRWADFWVLKLTSSGDIEWQKTYGGDYGDTAYSIQQTSDGGYIVAGELMSAVAGHLTDLWILKLSSTGDIEWQKTYEGYYKSAYSIQQTIDGGYIVAGKTMSFGAEGPDIWILKLSLNGEIEWQKAYGGEDGDFAYSIHQTSEGGYVVAGYTSSFGAGKGDFWVLKLFSTGEIEWQKTYGGEDGDYAHSIHQTSDGGYIVAGETLSFGAGGYDIWVLKLFPSGDIEWEKTYGGMNDLTNDDNGYSIQEKEEGGYIVAGYTECFASESRDFLILNLSPTGDIDPSCDIIGTSNASVESTSILPVDTSITPLDTNIIPSDTNVSPQDSDAYIILPCGLPKYDLTITVNPEGYRTWPSPGTYEVYYGKVEIRAEHDAWISYRYFSHWSGDVPQGHENDNPITIMMDSDKSIVANFILPFRLTISAGTGGTTSPSVGGHIRPEGTEVTITALPDSGYEFNGWSGDASGTTNPITITMDADKTITANFIATQTGGDGIEDVVKKGCFIATAAYGSPLHPHLDILRDFRDTYLMPTKLGGELVDLYYKYSPSVAELIAKNKVLKVTVQINLLPFVAFSYSMVRLGPIITVIMLVLVFMVPIFLILFFKKKREASGSQKP